MTNNFVICIVNIKEIFLSGGKESKATSYLDHGQRESGCDILLIQLCLVNSQAQHATREEHEQA